jgi:hypothetical protein
MTRLASTKTLVGDVKAVILEELADLPKPWQALGRIEQEIISERLNMRAYVLAAEALRLCGDELAGDAMAIPAMLESVSTKDAVKASLKVIGVNRHELAQHVGNEVRVLILPSAEDLLGAVPVPKYKEIAEEQIDAFDPLTAKGVSDAA